MDERPRLHEDPDLDQAIMSEYFSGGSLELHSLRLFGTSSLWNRCDNTLVFERWQSR
jgi:hypothetical protein